MIKSMTSFGRADSMTTGDTIISVEMKSVNNRYLDVNVKMPKFMIALEDKIRNRILNRIKRGKVELFVSYTNRNNSNNTCTLDLKLAKSYYECLVKLRDEFAAKDDISVSKLASFENVITVEPIKEDLDKISKELAPILDEALDKMVEMRQKEGERLKEDILIKLNSVEENVIKIEKLSADFPIDYKKKLEDRIKELTSNMTLNEDRIITEVAIFADKTAIDEEIIRLKSHISQMKSSLELDEPVGRKLDFIIQEMNREVNTMGSKSCNIELSNLVIDCKNTIEKIREQVQNIE